MLGFNFYQSSPRFIHLESCREITVEIKRHFPEIICVGVFVNKDPQQIRNIMSQTGLDLAQLSGNETPTTVKQMGSIAFKALRPKSLPELKQVVKSLPIHEEPPAFLIDSHQKGAFGGTGRTGNWHIAAEIAREYPILLAGGLKPENIADAIREVQPWGVDVASGVEIERGVKDPQKIKDFIHIARATSVELSNNERSLSC